VVRDVAEKSGTPYNKAAYEAETKREEDARAKRDAERKKAAEAQKKS
jgi:phosphonate transport system substrate-binding protein